jgi:hypothetical protein
MILKYKMQKTFFGFEIIVDAWDSEIFVFWWMSFVDRGTGDFLRACAVASRVFPRFSQAYFVQSQHHF